jgi:hypothetical protein
MFIEPGALFLHSRASPRRIQRLEHIEQFTPPPPCCAAMSICAICAKGSPGSMAWASARNYGRSKISRVKGSSHFLIERVLPLQLGDVLGNLF